MVWKIEIARDLKPAWAGVVEGDRLGSAQLGTLRSKLEELGAGPEVIARLMRRAEGAWTGSDGCLTEPGTQDGSIIDGRYELVLSRN